MILDIRPGHPYPLGANRDGAGDEMTDEESASDMSQSGVLLAGGAIGVRKATGEPVADDTLLLLFNGSQETLCFRMRAVTNGACWDMVIDMVRPDRAMQSLCVRGDEAYELAGRSVVLLYQRDEESPRQDEREGHATDNG